MCECLPGWVGPHCDTANYPGYALRLDGSQYATLSLDRAGFPPPLLPQVTVEVWVLPSHLIGWQRILSASDQASHGVLSLSLFNNHVVLIVEGASPKHQWFDYVLSAGHWVHLAVAFDQKALVVHLLVNGVLVDSRNYIKAPAIQLGHLLLGAEPIAPASAVDLPEEFALEEEPLLNVEVSSVQMTSIRTSAAASTNNVTLVTMNQGFEGAVDELRIWSRILSDASLFRGAFRRLKQNDPDRVLYMRFAEGLAPF